MLRVKGVLLPLLGLALGVMASIVAGRHWLGERALAAGRARQAQGDILGGSERYRAALAYGSGAAAAELARIALWRHDGEAAASFIRQASQINPTRGYLRILEASLIASRPGSWDQSRAERLLEAARAAVAISPGDPKLWDAYGDFVLGLYLHEAETLGRTRAEIHLGEAVQTYQEALRRDPTAAPRLFGEILDRTGDPEILVRVAAGTGEPALLSVAVGLLADRKLWAESAAAYWTAAEAMGVWRLFGHAAAKVHLGRGGLREAEEALRRLLEREPRDADACYMLGETLRRANRAEESRAYFRRAADLEPGNATFRRALEKS